MEKLLQRNTRKMFIGTVVSDKMQKTAVVEVETKTLHPKFKKLVISHTKFHIHDENNECKIGDKVSFIETRPLSHTKFYRLNKIIERAK